MPQSLPGGGDSLQAARPGARVRSDGLPRRSVGSGDVTITSAHHAGSKSPPIPIVNRDRIPLPDALARAAVPLAVLAALAALASREVDPVGAAETAYLAVLATAGLLAVAFLAPPPAWEVGVGATLAVTIVWALPPGPGRGAALILLLMAALAVAAVRRWSKDIEDSKDDKDKSSRALASFGSLLPLSLGLQLLLRGGELLFQPQLDLRLPVVLLGLPTAGAIATAMLVRRHGPAALTAAGAALLLAPGWNVAATAGLVALAAGDLIARWWGAVLAAAAVAGFFLLMPGAPDLSMAAGPLALVVLYLGRKILAVPAVATASLCVTLALLASYPWLRAEPLQSAIGLFVPPPGWPLLLGAIVLLGALESWRGLRCATGAAAGLVFLVLALQIPTPGISLLPPATTVVVDAVHPGWTASVGGKSVETVVFESSLSNGAGLVNGTPVATVRLRGREGRSSAWTLRAGAETGEWAARRPDVVAAAVLESPPAWISYVAGDFFGQRYRALWTVETPGPFTTLSIERNPRLPPEVSLAIHLLEVRK
jgi:hypothetical protein